MGTEREIEIQERDLDILLGLFECRVMSLGHVSTLHFEGRSESAKKRVQKLKASGLVRERARAVGEPSLLHLTTKAFRVLRESGKLDTFPAITAKQMEKRTQVSGLTLRHELEVMDVRAAFMSALRDAPGLSASEFSTWPALYQFAAVHASEIFGRRELTVKPDGFIRLREETGPDAFEHMFFLEVDRSTETQDIIGQKAACYLSFYQSGGMAIRFGGSRDDFRQFPFRVLMVFRNEERRNNAAERLLRNVPPVLTQVWLTTFPEVIENPLGAIWIRPKDYLEATRGTRFDPAASANSPLYRRQAERERLVAKTVPRLLLFESGA